MRRGRVFIYLALIIILGLVAAFVLFQRFSSQTPTEVAGDVVVPTPIPDDITVVVVTQNTPRGTLIDETLLTTISLPKNDAVEGIFFNDLASVVGRRAKFDLDSGIPLTASMLVDSAGALSATGSLTALQIPRGKIAISIPISRLSSVSYAPRAGDHVSIIVTMMFVDIDSEFQTILANEVYSVVGPGGSGEEGPPLITALLMRDSLMPLLGRTELDPLLNELVYVSPAERQRTRLVSQILLPDVEVLQVGNFPLIEEKVPEVAIAPVEGGVIEPSPEPLPEPVPVEEQAAPPEPDIITLIVSPQDAVTLNYLMYSGAELTLALRATGDDSVEETESATLQFLIDEYNITVPAKLPYGSEPRIDVLTPPVLENDLIVETGQ